MVDQETLSKAISILSNTSLEETKKRLLDHVLFGPKAIRCKRCEHVLDEQGLATAGETTCSLCSFLSPDLLGNFDSVEEMNQKTFDDVLKMVKEAGGETDGDCVSVGERYFRWQDGRWVYWGHLKCENACDVAIPSGYGAEIEAWWDQVREKSLGRCFKVGVASDGRYYALFTSGSEFLSLFGLESDDAVDASSSCESCVERNRALGKGRQARRASRRVLGDDVYSNEEVLKRGVEALGEDGFRFVQLVAQTGAEEPDRLEKVWQARSTTAALDALDVER